MKDLIIGGQHIDSRGRIVFFNTLSFESIKRFYMIELSSCDIRAWQGHKLENKWYFVLRGKLRLNVINFRIWDSDEFSTKYYDLDGSYPQIVHVPAGSITGFRPIDKDVTLMIFSDKKLHESLCDDYRFDNNRWTFK